MFDTNYVSFFCCEDSEEDIANGNVTEAEQLIKKMESITKYFFSNILKTALQKQKLHYKK